MEGAVDGERVLSETVLHHLLDRSADVTVLVDASTGRSIHRWYDPSTSRLHLPLSPTARAITWMHPDDLPAVLDVMAVVAHEGGSRSTVARVHPDHAAVVGSSLMIVAHDVSASVPFGILVHAWLVDFDAAALEGAEAGVAMSSLAEAAPVGLQVRSGNGSVSFENSRFSALVGAGRDEVEARISAALDSTAIDTVSDLAVDGRSLRLRVVPTRDAEHRLLLAVASLEDVTSQRAAEGLFRAVFDGSPVATAVVDLDGRFVQVNDALAMICGRPSDDLLGRGFAEITHPDDLAVDEELLAEVRAGRRGGYQMEKRFLHRAGHEVWVELTVSAVHDAAGAISHFVSHVEDISGRKALIDMADSSEDLAYWATHDHLTGLPNRRYLDSYLTSNLGPRRRADDHLVVLFLDLDDFKPVNDRHGHQTGDEVLRTIARRLRSAAREDELVARYGGDEFVVVTTRARTAYDVSLLAERILGAVRTPIVGLTEDPILVGASVGIGHAHGDEDPAALLTRADAASYRAKRAGKGRIEYAPGTV
ncbi:diguanylate cyclase [Acidimicrobiia bacterium EGI L10123]|uniref:diguanylate cyclase domain-containing protein n=1 Tax=Salinilacustrithrix flava TaxID=2957203 RepID=UPI003D7C2DA5|nr:diguanylate cyclase [Acidimicrobiia bacterium EGI L10123]